MLHVHRAERADRLAEALADVLVDPLDDPFTPEIVAVPTRGVERWLAHRLAHRLGVTAGDDGVCANVAFPAPAELVDTALGTGHDHPWARDRLVWPLLDVIDECVGQSWCEALTAYVGGDRKGRRHAAAHHVATLFARYAEHRPALIRAWAGKDDGEVPDDLRWQPELWRRLRDRVGVPCPAEDLPAACEHLRSVTTNLPARLSLFGPTRLSATHLAVIAALSAVRDVHLWVPHPSPALWDAIGELPPHTEAPRRSEEIDAAHHPLLASLGRDVRELQVRLAALDVPVEHHHHAAEHGGATLLAGLQHDLRHDRPTPHRPPDASLTVHACHGPDRQVEVLREVVLGRLAADPSLEPRDIVVLCPDIETYAPLVTAAFGLGSGEGAGHDDDHPGHRLAVRLADRSLRQVNPLLGTVATLLELADARVTASQVLDLAESAPVRRRFSFDDDDVARLRGLVAEAGVRWGLDADHRAPYKLAGFPQNTWSTGLDRLLLGAAMADEGHRWLGTALPCDDVDSDAVDLVGRAAELVDRLQDVLGRLAGERPLTAWVETLLDGLDRLTSTTPADAWQITQARAELTETLTGSGDTPLDLADVRDVLAERLAGRPTRANFRTGTLTVATLLPMRSVPHRVICLLGLDDGVFPREAGEDGDDVLARDPRVGERDPRSEDRQLLLDAVVAATEHLVVIHSGADERTNARREPAVPLGELLDVVGRDVVVRHPLQPFDARDFRAAGPSGRPFSFDRAGLAGARRAEHARIAPARFLDGPLPALDEPVTGLDDLVRFVEHPVKAFLAQRLGIHPGVDDEEPDDALPVDLDGLERWQIGDRLLADRLAGADLDACRQAEWRRGALPPGSLGTAVLADLARRVEPLVAAGAPLLTTAERQVDVDVALDAARLVGTVTGVRDDTLVTITYSTLAAKHRLRAWVTLLALTAHDPTRRWRAVTVGRWGSRVARSTLGPVDPETARVVLADLCALRREGLREPLPLVTKSSCAYGEAAHRGSEPDDAWSAATDAWNDKVAPERDDAACRQVWGRVGLDDLDADRFGVLARRLWLPLLAAERKDRS